MGVKGYGVKVTVSPDVSNLQKALNKKKLSIKISEIILSDSLLGKAQKTVQTALDKGKFEIKINKASITDACKKSIQDQLTKLYKFEPQKDTRGSGLKQSAGGSAKDPVWQTQRSSIDSWYRKLRTAYDSTLGYSTEHVDSTKRVTIENEIASAQDKIYNTLVKINQLKNDGVQLSDAEFQNLHSEVASLLKKESLLRKEYSIPKDIDIDKLDKYYQTLHKWLENNSKAKGTQQGDIIESAMRQIQDAAVTGKMDGREFDTVRKEVVHAQKECERLGLIGKNTFDKIYSAIEKFGGWTLITQSVGATIRYIKNMSVVVTELDSAMTSLKKVTDETDYVYEKFAKRAEVTATAIGATVSQYITSTADYARLGYSIPDAEELARVSAIYANVGDNIDETSATESIISTMKAFDLSADQAKLIVDKFNRVGNEFAIGSDGLGEVFKRSASAMHAAQNDIDETIALATAMNTVLQDPDKVGTTIKTVSMFLRAAHTEAEAAGEATDGMAQSVSDLRADILQLTNEKVDIMIDDNTYKNTYEILQEISKVWSSLTDIDRANLLELLGGKRNANAVAAVIENFAIAEKALVSSQNSAGSAMVENEKYLDSVAGATERYTAAQQALTSTLLNSEVLVTWKNVLTGIIQGLDTGISVLDGWPASVLLITATVQGLVAAWTAVSTGIQMSTKAMKIFNAVQGTFNPKTLALMAFVAIITAVIKQIQWYAQAEERAKETFDKSIETYAETKQKLAEVNSELQTTQDRIAELQAQNSLTLVEQTELNKLKEVNAQLLRQKELLSADAQAGLNQAQNDFVNYMDKAIINSGSIEKYLSDIEGGLGDYYHAATYQEARDFILREIDSINKAIEDILPGASNFISASEGQNTIYPALLNGEITEAEYDSLTKLMEKRQIYDVLETASGTEKSWEGHVGDHISTLNSLLEEQSKLLEQVPYEQLTPKSKEFVDTIDDMHYKVLLASGDINAIGSVFSSVFFSDRFQTAREQIEGFGNGTRLTAKDIEELASNNPEVQELLNYLEELGLINLNSSDWAEQTAKQLNDADMAAAGLNKSLKKLEEYSKELDDIRSAFSSVKSVIEDFNKNGGYLSVENYQTLVNLGSEYLRCLVDENGQIKLNTQAYADLAKVQMQNMLLSKIQSSIDNIMGGSAAQAAELAAAANYSETNSLYALIEAKLRDAYATAKQKDAESGTNAFTSALKAQLPYWSSLVSFYDKACAGLDQYGMYGYDAAEANERLTKSLQKQKEEWEDAQSNIQSLIDLVTEMIKQEKELEKEAYEEQKDHIVDLIDKRKELLEAKKEEADFNKELSEKQNTVAQNALSASLAELDNSSSGHKASKEARDALAESRSELQGSLSDHELDTRLESLDKLKETTEQYYDSLIDEIDEYLDDDRKMYEDACTMIDNDNGTLYKKLKDYVYKYTTQTEAEFDHMWTKAQKGLKDYDNAHTPLWETMSTLQGNISDTTDVLDDLSEAANASVEKSTAAIGSWNGAFQEMLKSWEKVESGSPSAPKWKYKHEGVWYFSDKSNRDEAAWDISSQLNDKFPTGFITSQLRAYASGTLSASGGISMVGENGAELRVLNKGDGIIPADITKNLWAFGKDPEGVLSNLLKRLSTIDLLGGLLRGARPSPIATTANTSISAPISITITGDATHETVNTLKKLTPQIANAAAKKVMETALRYSSVPRKI